MTPHFAAAQVHNLRAAREQLAGSAEIAALDGLVQSGSGDAVDGGLQFRPAFKPIGTCQHELGVTQRKGLGRGGEVTGGGLGDGFQRRRTTGFEQFPGMTFQWIEAGVRRMARVGGF